MRFVGIDLAWSDGNTSAAVALALEGDEGRLIAWEDDLGGDDEVYTFVREAVGEGPGLVAVDAPLLVPNEEGARPCDLEVSREFRRDEAGGYPANRRRLGCKVRGEGPVS